MANRFAIFLWLAIFAPTINAQQFTAPEQVVFANKTYNLAYKNSSPNGQAIYEYTSNDEPIEKWSSLVTVNYYKSVVAPPLKWLEVMKASLDRRQPKPHYNLYLKGNNSYAKIIFEPDSKNPDFESNVQKSFHMEACGGLVIYQFAQKYPPSADQTPEGKLTALKTIANENAVLAELVEKSEWLPTCK